MPGQRSDGHSLSFKSIAAASGFRSERATASGQQSASASSGCRGDYNGIVAGASERQLQRSNSAVIHVVSFLNDNVGEGISMQSPN
jgi:hypothetical protein